MEQGKAAGIEGQITIQSTAVTIKKYFSHSVTVRK
jgi:hypothetical protein